MGKPKFLICRDIPKNPIFLWLFKHRCLNAIKRQLYHERVHSLIYDKIKDQFENPDTYFVNELTENITKAIEELPENYRETFKLSRFGEQSNPQIAEALGFLSKPWNTGLHNP